MKDKMKKRIVKRLKKKYDPLFKGLSSPHIITEDQAIYDMIEEFERMYKFIIENQKDQAPFMGEKDFTNSSEYEDMIFYECYLCMIKNISVGKMMQKKAEAELSCIKENNLREYVQ